MSELYESALWIAQKISPCRIVTDGLHYPILIAIIQDLDRRIQNIFSRVTLYSSH